MIVGDMGQIDLGTSSFAEIITHNCLYVDKSRLIERFLNEAPKVQLIARQRRMGKSLNMDMLRCFLTDATDNRHLFQGLYIEKSPVWEQANSAPVFLFDFKNLNINRFRGEILRQIDDCLALYICDPSCPEHLRRHYHKWYESDGEDSIGLFLLTQIVYAVTGKKSYLLIDEYDNLLFNAANTPKYKELREYFTELYSAGMKGNNNLEKALLSGVTRISHEGMLSGLNNITTYDIFSDEVYLDDYGFTEVEMDELAVATGFDREQARDWYNGIKIGGQDIYNTFGVMSMIRSKKFNCYWGKSGSMENIVTLLKPERQRVILELLEPGNTAIVDIEDRIGPEELFTKNEDSMFYSLLVQSGYLSLESLDGVVAIPNVELREVWERFLLNLVIKDKKTISNLLINITEPEGFAQDLVVFLQPLLEGLSYYDLPKKIDNDNKKLSRTPELYYHLFLYGVLSVCRERLKFTRLLSNRESGDGRYDILMEFSEHVIVFELKSAAADEDLAALAQKALEQIKETRYGADLGKPVVAVGLAFRGKDCAAVAL